MADDPRVRRRHLLNGAVAVASGVAGAAVLYPTCRMASPVAGEARRIADAGPLESLPAGQARQIELDGMPVWLVRRADAVRAFSARCPHLGCVVGHADRGFRCACHGGRFSEDGVPVAGPPKRPLRELAVDVVDGRIWVRT